MQTTIRILMTDDHPMIIEGYQNTLIATKKPNQNLKIDIANNCDESIKFMENAVARNNPYDVLFMDISLPPSTDGKFNNGEDLAMHAKSIMPKAKIIILTMFNEVYRIHNIVRTINPEGFLIKSDLTSKELANAFQAVLSNPPFYSGTVNSLIRKTVSTNIVLDDVNRKILYLLSQGIKTKNLKEYIDLSLSAIEKRKKYMKEVLFVEDGSDESLLDSARDKGII
ncbi:DNA-binding response regulator [Xanthomarina sp. F1114]|uniref:DNA-binding response regulator n=1 Tax=Xanthomarina sp. F1114 TaxID=2996019 RepID=UPI00225E16B8|nr:DNA-binding response regulator [Xanthomarina sp. F1114]MCX7546970.1 DNA-binding response regulator [Xanthomarina sp. F1114]